MKDTSAVPLLGVMPKQYSDEQVNAALRKIENYFKQLTAVGPIRVSSININALPTSATGLRAGDLWNDSGTVKVVP